MSSILNWLFYTGRYMSHGHCYLWNPALVSLHVVSDLLIFLAYVAISLTLLYLVRRTRSEIPFHWMLVAFGTFIIACGCTHLIEVITIWKPVYWLAGFVKAVTALASVTTAVILPRLVPEALEMIQNARQAREHRLELEQANAAFRRLNEELEERVRARTAQLAEANEQLAEKAAIVSHTNDAIFSKNLDRLITSWNPGAERIYGYTAAEVVGRSVSLLIPEERMPELDDAMDKIGKGELVESFETVRVRKDGQRIDVHLTISPVCDAEGKVRGASVIARDVTDRRRAEQQLRETQKLESLGVIAGGIAHDFNNLLVGILGNASLVLESLPDNDTNRPFLENVLTASEKAAHLTKQLLAYAGKGRFLNERINLTGLVKEIGNLLRTSIPKSVTLKLELDEQLPSIDGDPSQFQQLIMNLLINGAEAIGEARHGTVIVATSAVSKDDAEYVRLEVSDTGSGMDEETRSKIFDPFFTTKFTGRGLGLAAVLGIVRAHRGTIQVDSEPGRGTTFTVLLPASRNQAAVPPARAAQADLHGAGTVLVVDDEDLVRSMASATLKRFGYQVLTAENGQEAVDIFREHADEIVAILLDMTMPVMGGEEAMRRIRGMRPEARVIVSSGYNEIEAVKRFTRDVGPAGFIQKPYTAIKLAAAVRRIVDGTSGEMFSPPA
jgi:PAS domain S-box-containing protein